MHAPSLPCWAGLGVACLGFLGELVAEPVIPEDGSLERLATGFITVEGPLYADDGTFYFTDIPNNHIWSLDTTTLEKTLVRKDTGGANGLVYDAKGRMLMCKGAGKCLARLEADGSETVLFEPVRQRADGKMQPVGVNDVVIDRSGAIYITVPGAGCVYLLDPDGTHPRPLVSGLEGPNGLTLSPDETRLYVSEYKRQTLHVYDLDTTKGVATNGRVFATVTEASDYGCDGMTVDTEGNVYCAGPHAVRVWDPDGELIARIAVPESPTNCEFGGTNGSVLYITGRESVFRIPTAKNGAR